MHHVIPGHKHLRQILLGLRPPRIAMFLVAVAAILHLILPIVVAPRLQTAAIMSALAGFAIMLRAWWLFREAATPICPTANATVLITGDVYAITRNPMYLGMLLMLLGIALFSGSAAFYATAAVYFAILNFVFCPFEEQRLRAEFAAYEAYESRVRRWI